MERSHKSPVQNHNTQLSHYTQICKQCSPGYKTETPARSAPRAVTHPKKTNPTDILRGSTLPAASTPLQGEAEYPVFNWQLSQRLLCLFSCPHLAQTDTSYSTTFLKWALGMLSRSTQANVYAMCQLFGGGMEYKHAVSAFP